MEEQVRSLQAASAPRAFGHAEPLDGRVDISAFRTYIGRQGASRAASHALE